MYYGQHKVDGSYGFFQRADKCLNAVEITEETWKALMAGQQNGKQIVPDETGAPVLQKMPDNRTYAEKRAAEYPNIADFLDAQVKINSGDETLVAAGQEQLSAYVAACLAVKAKYPKEGETDV